MKREGSFNVTSYDTSSDNHVTLGQVDQELCTINVV